ncbi:hypothetical protein KAT24_01905 [Candidatus Pacearchaeota archaeon]|nr:hypothetical protein [Candidatus Pacearchaeota archaeon]
MNNNNFLYKQINTKELEEMREFNSRFFRKEEIKIKKEKEKQRDYSMPFMENKKYN